jgi:SAM-dependent methyltransferase
MPGIKNTSRHQTEISRNRSVWENKPLLREVYADFHAVIANELADISGITAELGSGIGSVAATIPGCLMTDLEVNPGVDQVEDAYQLSWSDNSVANLILFDVFHHIRFPGSALAEFERVLAPGGRLLIFEPCVSLLGRLVYGLMHPEPLALKQPIEWWAPTAYSGRNTEYYAAQGNASRIFCGSGYQALIGAWDMRTLTRFSAISYVASGGFSGPQLYPLAALPLMRGIDRLADVFPGVFATRLLVVLQAGKAGFKGAV